MLSAWKWAKATAAAVTGDEPCPPRVLGYLGNLGNGRSRNLASCSVKFANCSDTGVTLRMPTLAIKRREPQVYYAVRRPISGLTRYRKGTERRRRNCPPQIPGKPASLHFL